MKQEMSDIKVIRAEKYWQKAGASYVRIQAMARQYKIPLNVEFDEIDNDENTKYIVLMDNYLPIACCRIFEDAPDTVHFGRVIVLEEYRGRGLGARVIREAEKWALDLGYSRAVLEARDVAVGFYEKLGYIADMSRKSFDTFSCVHMEKEL